ELAYALKNNIKYGSVKNAKGKAIKADAASVTAAAKATAVPDDFRDLSITNADAEDAYPISGTVFCIVYVKQPAGKGKPIQDFLTWVLPDGQKRCEKLDYAPLPENVVKKAEEKVKAIEAK